MPKRQRLSGTSSPPPAPRLGAAADVLFISGLHVGDVRVEGAIDVEVAPGAEIRGRVLTESGHLLIGLQASVKGAGSSADTVISERGSIEILGTVEGHVHAHRGDVMLRSGAVVRGDVCCDRGEVRATGARVTGVIRARGLSSPTITASTLASLELLLPTESPADAWQCVRLADFTQVGSLRLASSRGAVLLASTSQLGSAPRSLATGQPVSVIPLCGAGEFWTDIQQDVLRRMNDDSAQWWKGCDDLLRSMLDALAPELSDERTRQQASVCFRELAMTIGDTLVERLSGDEAADVLAWMSGLSPEALARVLSALIQGALMQFSQDMPEARVQALLDLCVHRRRLGPEVAAHLDRWEGRYADDIPLIRDFAGRYRVEQGAWRLRTRWPSPELALRLFQALELEEERRTDEQWLMMVTPLSLLLAEQLAPAWFPPGTISAAGQADGRDRRDSDSSSLQEP